MGRLITTTAVPPGFPLSQFNVPTATSNTVSVWLAIPVREAISPKANRTINICLIGIISRPQQVLSLSNARTFARGRRRPVDSPAPDVVV